MRRAAGSFILLSLSMIVGCQQPHKEHATAGGPPRKPARPAELAKLEPMVGHWRGTAEVVFPEIPKNSGKQESFVGESTSAWAMDGMWLKTDGWHEMPDGQKQSYIEYITWDAKANKFHSFYMSDWGDCGESWMSVSADGKQFDVLSTGANHEGKSRKGQGSMTLVDHNTMKWTWSETGPDGTMKIQGTSTRQ